MPSENFPFLRKFLDFWIGQNRNSCPSMHRDPEVGNSNDEERFNLHSTQNSENQMHGQHHRTSKHLTILCSILIFLPLIAFIVLTRLVGASSEKLGLTPEQPSASLNPRIVGGSKALKGEYRHQILLKIKGKDSPICGGSLLRTNVVITTAHCFERSEDPNDYLIVAGEHDTTVDEGTEQTVNVLKIIKFPDYDHFHTYNDIALLFLTTHVELNKYVKEISIYEGPLPSEGTVVGWGVQSEADSRPVNILNKVVLPILSLKECRDIYGDSVAPDGSSLCAGFPEGEKDACQADSGGPILKMDDDNRSLIGLVSWGVGCGREKNPGVYTNVQFFSEWINHTIAGIQ